MNDDLIQKMLLETFLNSDGEDAPLLPNILEQHFQDKKLLTEQNSSTSAKKDVDGSAKLLKKFDDLQVVLYPVELISEISCFRCQIGTNVLDFPVNWSFFDEFQKKDSSSCFFLLSYANDKVRLLNIFSTISRKLTSAIFLKNNTKFFLLTFSEAEAKLCEKVLEEIKGFSADLTSSIAKAS